MKLNEYQEAARATAVYNTPLMYPSLGLAGELGELIEKIVAGSSSEDTKGEIGDVLWYCASVAHDCGFDLESACGVYAVLNGLTPPTTFPDLGDYVAYNITDPLPELSVAVGKVCEVAKKVDRDSGGKLSPEKRETICFNTGKVVYLLLDLAIEHGFTLDEVAQANLDKLSSRAARGVLKGEGDNR